MGILPLEFINGEGADSLGLNGTEQFTIDINDSNLMVNKKLTVTTSRERLIVYCCERHREALHREISIGHRSGAGVL
jgi:aconitase A